MTNDTQEFVKCFHALTDNPPFPWQCKLYEKFTAGDIPSTCSLPTGLGKTSVIAIWLIARAKRPEKMPRRLVYVVNRRTVVDQTTDEVEKLRENLAKPELKEFRDQLGLSEKRSLAISTLRGQFADNREWSVDPSRPAVICGTVDMIGSRLLFSGYGVGYKGKPLHAGFLGCNALVVHDEAHLEPAFQALLEGIEFEQESCPNEKGQFRVMALSATTRNNPAREKQEKPFELTAADQEHPEIVRRIRAAKKLILTPQSGKLGEQLAATAIALFKDSGRPVIIFVRLVDDLKLALERLRKAKFEPLQLTGTMRGWERESLPTDPRFIRFLPESNRSKKIEPAEGTVFLVCTSAGEVGVNISADHLLCDLSTFESMAQRFGRVNRFGLHSDTEIHVIHPSSFGTPGKDGKTKIEEIDLRRQKTLNLLKLLNDNASPASLGQFCRFCVEDAFSPTLTILPATDILFDAWSMTSIRDRMPGRQNVEPYLHGIRDWEPPETQVAWREEVGVIVGDLLEEYPPEDLLDEYPLKPHELLRDRTKRVRIELLKLAERYPDKPVWIVDEQGAVEVIERFSELAAQDEKFVDARLKDKTVLLPHDIGGLTAEGTLDGNPPPVPKPGEEPTKINNDVADKLTNDAGTPLRVRLMRVGTNENREFYAKSEGMRHILCIDFHPPEDNEDAVKRSWYWFELPLPKDNSKNASRPVLLDVHVADVEEKAKQIVDGLTFDPDETINARIKRAILLAAKFHDLGKKRERWQRSIGRPIEHADIWFGKSGRRWKPRDITDYRHEFGSLVDLQSVPEFQALDEDAKDLVQHLIGAHHGQARPHFTATQIIDPDPGSKTPACEALAIEVPRRFARLQRKYGRWGLAYLESILRAADWHASANPSEFFKEGADS